MNAIHTKPKLAFFQYKYDERLAEFLLMHTREHVKCLSEFFEVAVITGDCDYQRVCDKHQPDLALFESGPNYLTCQRPKIANVHACPTIPKLGFFNADAWCETRSATLSEMDQWGIETFFAISTTAAEHMPEIANKLFTWPNFIDSDLYRDYGQSKLIPVLLTGSTAPQYPWRRRIFKLISEHYPSLSCPHLGYSARSIGGQVMYGERYARTINASFVAPVCGTIAKEVVRKHFEIPGCKACMVTEKSPGLQAAGFVDMKNCVFADGHDVLDKVAYLFEHPEELQAITDAGYQLVHSRHTLKHRDQILQWFRLYKNLRAHEKIVQTSPFEQLSIVSTSSKMNTSHLMSNGLHLALLRQGDEKLWAGEYEEAESLYRQCLNYMRRLPEARLRLSLCMLYKGDAKRARESIFELIQDTLAEYKAVDPDPVEWAYYIISLLCLGQSENASKCASEFPWLRHVELDRTRQVINVLKHKNTSALLNHDGRVRYRCSVHQLPSRSNAEWLEQLRAMIKVCSQSNIAETLMMHISREIVRARQRKDSSSTNRCMLPTGDVDNCETRDSKVALPPGRKRLLGVLNRQLVYYKFRRRVKKAASLVLRQAETKYGYLLPFFLAKLRNDEFSQATQDLAQDEDIRTVLIIGASLRERSTAALLSAVLENGRKPSIFCISDARHRSMSFRSVFLNQSLVKWYRLPSSSSPENASTELEKIVQKIKEDNRLDFFDVLLIDGSELSCQSVVSAALSKELNAAGRVLLDDTNTGYNRENYERLRQSRSHLLVDHNSAVRDGYAIFKRGGSAAKRVGDALLSDTVLTE